MRLALGVEYDGSGFHGWQRLSASGTQAPDGSLQEHLHSRASAGRQIAAEKRSDGAPPLQIESDGTVF